MVSKVEKIINFVCGQDPSDVCVLTIQQLVRTMEQTCAQCQADRKYVLLDPQCKDRFYLSLLVEAGVPYNEYPTDCYKIRLEEIKKVLQGKPTPVPVVDAVVRLKDFIKLLAEIYKSGVSKRKISSTKTAEKMIDIIKEIAESSEKIYYWGWNRKIYLTIKTNGNIMVNLLDIDKDIAYVNLYERPVRRENLRQVIEHLFSVLGVDGEVYSSPTGNIYIRFEIESKEKVSKIKSVENIEMRVTNPTGGKHKIMINVLNPHGGTIRYKELLDILAHLGESK